MSTCSIAMARTTLCLLLMLALADRARAYDAAALAADAGAFVSAEALMHRDLSASIAALRKSQPLLSPGDAPVWSADLSWGQVIAPSFEYRELQASSGPFSGDAFGAGSGPAASADVLSGGGAMAFPGGLGLTLNASYLPPLQFDGAERSLFRIGASGYWRLLPERFYSTGLLAGCGATYVRGTESRALAASFTDAGVARSFEGTLDSQWDSGVLDLELFLHKTFFIVNFYGRADYCLVFGASTATLSDIKVDGAVVTGAQAAYGSTLRAPGSGLVLSGGLELILGELKLTAEAGKDWLSGALYGSAGLRFGM